MSTERTPVHTGGCQCGAVRYALYAEPTNASICHCRMCQKAFGSFFAPLAGVSQSDFATTSGTIAIFKSSDVVERGFCNTCGTPLTFRYVDGVAWEGVANEIHIAMGSLDEPARVKPTMQYGVESRLPWFHELSALKGKSTAESTDATVLETIEGSNHQHPDRE